MLVKVYGKSGKRVTTSGSVHLPSPELSTGFLVARGCSDIIEGREEIETFTIVVALFQKFIGNSSQDLQEL